MIYSEHLKPVKYTVAVNQKGLKSIFFILSKWQNNNWHCNNFSTIGHKLTILGHKRDNLAYFENIMALLKYMQL